jgi:Domain of unknown function (DUF4440)
MGNGVTAIAIAIAAWMPVAFAADRLADLQSVVDAERAFAARAQVINPRQAFIEYFAPDAIAYTPFPGPAFPSLHHGPDWPVNIQWRPVAAAISGAGDMGYTTGPSEYRKTAADPPTRFGHYTSVWQRQQNGRLLVRIDIGIDHPAPAQRAPDWQPPVQQPVAAPPLSPDRRAAAERQMRELDARIGAAAREDPSAAFAQVLSDDARLHLGGHHPVIGRVAALATLGGSEHAFTWSPEGAAMAESGDFGFTYGRGNWTRGSTGQSGDLVYLNVWQLRSGVWRIIVHVSHVVQPRPSQ